jgi:yecA family protein
MHEDLAEEVGVFDFDEFADHLVDQGMLVSPSQLHGCLCGVLCAGAPTEAEYGLDALSQALDIVMHGELASRIMQLYTVTEVALKDEEFTFLPLLPDDDEEIALRTSALASWCDGFMSGFAYVIAGNEATAAALSQDTGEVLKDVAAMAQAHADDEIEEDAEDSYMELVEYLRAAVVNVFLDSLATTEDTEVSSETGRLLH